MEPGPAWIIPGLLPADAATIMSGKSKVSQKTWLAFAMANAVASGTDVSLFAPAVHGPVLVIEEEGPSKLTGKRWEMLEAGIGVPMNGLPIFFSHREGVLLNNKAWQDRICGFVRSEGVKLVILDTFAKVFHGDENSVEDVSNAMRIVDTVRHASPGCTVLIVHHLRKEFADGTNPDIDDELRGSSALAGYYDTHFALRKRQPNQPWVGLEIRHKDGEGAHYQVEWDISEANGIASFAMRAADPRTIDDATRTRCLGEMFEGEAYTAKRLQEVWHLDRDATLLIADGAVKSRELVRSGKTYIRPVSTP